MGSRECLKFSIKALPQGQTYNTKFHTSKVISNTWSLWWWLGKWAEWARRERRLRLPMLQLRENLCLRLVTSALSSFVSTSFVNLNCWCSRWGRAFAWGWWHLHLFPNHMSSSSVNAPAEGERLPLVDVIVIPIFSIFDVILLLMCYCQISSSSADVIAER